MPRPVSRRRDEDDDEKYSDRYAPSKKEAEDDEDERPSRAERRRQRLDDDEPAPRASRRSRDEDEPEEKEEPRRSRRARDEPDEDDEPPRRSRRDRDDEDEPRSSRRSRDDDDDDEPRRGKKVEKSSGGWGAWKKQKDELGGYAHDLKVPDDDEIVVKFLDDEPFATYADHWITVGSKKNRRTCIAKKDERGCPLCDSLGDKAKAMAAFNVVKLVEGEDPELFVWAASPGIVSTIQEKAESKTGPLTREYYSVKKSKKKDGPVIYVMGLVKGRDLMDDWGITPLSEREIDVIAEKVYDEASYVTYPPRAELREFARGVADADD